MQKLKDKHLLNIPYCSFEYTPTPLAYTIAMNKDHLTDALMEVDEIDHTSVPEDGKSAYAYPLMSLIYSEKFEYAKQLIGRGAPLNSQDFNGYTPLIHACRYPNVEGALDIIKLLIDAGADQMVKPKYGKTAIMHVWDSGNADIVEKANTFFSKEAFDQGKLLLSETTKRKLSHAGDDAE